MHLPERCKHKESFILFTSVVSISAHTTNLAYSELKEDCALDTPGDMDDKSSIDSEQDLDSSSGSDWMSEMEKK